MKPDPMKRRMGLAGLTALITIVAVFLIFWSRDFKLDDTPGQDATRAEQDTASAGKSAGAEQGGATGTDQGVPKARDAAGRGVPKSPTEGSAEEGEEGPVDGGFGGFVQGAETESADGGLSEEARAQQKIRCHVMGRVTRQAKPARDVEVLLHPRFDFGEFERARSDAEGRFEFADLHYGVWNVTALAEKAFAKGALLRCDAEDKEIPVELTLEEPSVHVSGRVTDMEDTPLAGAYLSVGRQDHPRDIQDNQVIPVTTEGRYEFWLPKEAEAFAITAAAPGYQSMLRSAPRNQSEVVLDFRLLRESVLRGEVVGPSGLLSGVKVSAYHQNPGGGGYVHSDTTDAKGRFEIEVGDGEITIAAWSPTEGYAYEKLQPLIEGQLVDWLVLQLKEGRKVTGTMRLKSGTRVPLGWIHFYCEQAGFGVALQADGQGDFTLPNIPSGLPIMVAPREDRRPFVERYTEVPPNQNTLELVLFPQED